MSTAVIQNRDTRLIEWSVFHSADYYGGGNIERLLKTGNSSQKKEPRTSREIIFDDIEDEETYLKRLDPKEWRKQDHYAVLGLRRERFKATDDDIKRAYRRLVLKHHPDKRSKEDQSQKDGDYFTCITKAWETLGNKQTRKAYDSIDPYFDDSIPSISTCGEGEFFDIFSDYFRKNAIWSEIKPVPLLGDINSSRDAVEAFYNFWFSFRSWRDYSYDFEEPNTNLDRDERRYIEKTKKAERAELKRAEMTRIRKLVDVAYVNDPRIRRFKLEDKDKKLAAKRAKEQEIKAKKLMEEQKIKENEEREKKAKEEEEARKRQEQEAARAKQAQLKKAVKRVKKNIRDLCSENGFYVQNGENEVKHMMNLDQVCNLLNLEELETFYKNLSAEGRSAFVKKIEMLNSKIEEERTTSLNSLSQKENTAGTDTTPWSQKEFQLLIKAVKLYPPGTDSRWNVISDFISQHSDEAPRSVTEIMSKAKEMQKMKIHQKSNEIRGIVNMANPNPIRPWTQVEQDALEKGLKQYSGPDRWDGIAKMIPSRSKQEVMDRYKFLVEAVKAKRISQKASS